MSIDRLKATMGRVNVQSVAEKRGELRDAIKAVLAHDAKPYGLEVTDFQLTDLQYTEAFRQAVNNAAVQKANIESVEYQRQQAQKSAEMVKIQAEGQANALREKAHGEADARLLNATAEAKAIQLQGEAQATAIKAQAEALRTSTELVELRKAERGTENSRPRCTRTPRSRSSRWIGGRNKSAKSKMSCVASATRANCRRSSFVVKLDGKEKTTGG